MAKRRAGCAVPFRGGAKAGQCQSRTTGAFAAFSGNALQRSLRGHDTRTEGTDIGRLAYAWHAGVYPEFNDSVRLHRPFAEQFDVPRDMVQELKKFLDDRWLKKDVPSFYQLEDYYDVRSERGFWDRMKLVDTLPVHV